MDTPVSSEQQVNGLTKWVFVILMILLTATYAYFIICNFNKVTCPDRFNIDKFSAYIDSVKNSAIISIASNASGGIDTLKKATNKDSIALLSPAAVKDYLNKNSGCNQDEREFQHTLLILVACCGGLGSMIFILSSFVNFWGTLKLQKSWLAWYVAKPAIGMGLALLSYFALRAGFLTASVSSSDINIYGVLCIAGLVGLFTDDATLKLKEVFEVIFKPDDKRSGKLDNNQSSKPASTGGTPTGPLLLTILKMDPLTLKPGVESEVTITGHNFPDDFHIKYNNEVLEAKNIISSDENVIKFKLPAMASTIKEVKISIYDPKENKDADAGAITIKE